MEHQRDFLFRAIDGLENAQIPYAITGSWASTTYGMPRTTHDLDIVVSIAVKNVPALVAAFPPPIYADPDWIQEAVALGQFFNIIDPTLGLKIDFWPLKNDEYSQQQFARRRQINILDRLVWMFAPEDIILAKLLWHKLLPSETQIRDSAGVWQAQRETLDTDYLHHWAARLEVNDLLAKIISG